MPLCERTVECGKCDTSPRDPRIYAGWAATQLRCASEFGTASVSERNYADIAMLEARVRDLAAAQKIDRDIAARLTAEGLLSARGHPFSGGEVHLLRKRWKVPTVKINGTSPNPLRWPDGTFSVQGAAAALSVSPQTVFKWIQKGRLSGRQVAKGIPWQITLSNPISKSPP